MLSHAFNRANNCGCDRSSPTGGSPSTRIRPRPLSRVTTAWRRAPVLAWATAADALTSRVVRSQASLSARNSWLRSSFLSAVRAASDAVAMSCHGSGPSRASRRHASAPSSAWAGAISRPASTASRRTPRACPATSGSCVAAASPCRLMPNSVKTPGSSIEPCISVTASWCSDTASRRSSSAPSSRAAAHSRSPVARLERWPPRPREPGGLSRTALRNASTASARSVNWRV